KQYIALGPDTPLHDQFQQLLPDLQSGMQEEKGESPSEESAEQAGASDTSGGQPPPDQNKIPLSFKDARAKAGADMKGGNMPVGKPKGEINIEVLQAARKKKQQQATTKA